jgi:small-conductance mechanosensitive channel
MRSIFDTFGITWPDYADWVSAGVAAAILLAIWAAAHFLARLAGPRLSRFWSHRGGRGEELAAHMCGLTRYLTALILTAVALNADDWRPLALVVLGIGVAVPASLFVLGLLRVAQLPAWIAAVLAAVTFVALLTRAVGGLKPITDLLNRIGFNAGTVRVSLLTALQAGVTIIALYAGVRLVNRIVSHSIARARGLDATQQLLAQKLAGVAVVVVAFFVGIDVLGIDLTAFTVFSGAFGLAVGFGLQKTFGNLIAGIILLMDRSVKPGDVITVGDTFGHVSKIGVRAVSIVTRDGKEHLIPNENLMTQEVENWSYSSRDVRVHIPVGVGYDCDLALAQRLMIEAATGAGRVKESPPPTVWLRGFGESSVDHEILVWIADPEAGVGSVRSEVLNRVWTLFKEHGVVLPNPQRDIHIKEWPAPPPAGD